MRIGDPVAPLGVQEWIGDKQPQPLDTPGLSTVLEFWGSWCPTSRLMLARHDSLQGALLGRPVQFIAVSQERVASLRPFLAEAAWSHLILGSDADKTLFRDVFLAAQYSDRSQEPYPYAFIIGDADGVSGRLLWRGPVAEPNDEEPLRAFEAALEAVLDGSHDLEAEMERERQEKRSLALFPELGEAAKARDLDRVAALLIEVDGLQLARGYRNTLYTNMNAAAWQLATSETKNERQLALALRAVEIGLPVGGAESPAFLDTQARVLYEMGRLEEAVEIQRRAVDLAEGKRDYCEFREVLARYRSELGLPPEDPELPAMEPERELVEAWSGNLNECLQISDDKVHPVLVSPAVADSVDARAWSEEMESLQARFSWLKGCPVMLPSELDLARRSDIVPRLYGSPGDNTATREILAAHGIELRADGVKVVEQWLPVENPVLIVCLPNPFHPELPVQIYTAFRSEDAHKLNSFFHGPTAMVVGRWEGAKPKPMLSLDFDLEAAAGNPMARPLLLAPSRLNTEEAIEDLQVLQELLATQYAGYADIAWRLNRAGSSWRQRLAEFEDRIAGMPEWEWGSFFELLRDFLAPVQDTHFSLSGTGSVQGSMERCRASFITTYSPFFTDLRLRLGPEGPRVVSTPPALERLRGRLLTELPIVDGPHATVPGRPYLFPTLPESGIMTGDDLYLLGLLADRAKPPTSLRLSLRGSGIPCCPDPMGRIRSDRSVEIPVHRGRSALGERGGPWSLEEAPESPIPLLAVRSMNVKRLGGLAETADRLHAEPALVLDLRGNPGGSDRPAMRWCQRFSGQDFEWKAFVGLWPPGQDDPLHSYISFPGGFRTHIAGPDEPRAPQPYAGELFVLVDKGVASSGESFVNLAGQVPGALLVGENSAGCVSYGNVSTHEPLPHSRIRVSCGRTKFVDDWIRPVSEGFGFFPDYWLDTEDPVALVNLCLHRSGNELEDGE